MVSRFNSFNDSEKDIIRMALRQFADKYFEDNDPGSVDDSMDKYLKASTLIYELVKGNR